jgi:hypothetical protein
MANKTFKIEGSSLYIEESGVVIFEQPKSDVFFDSKELITGNILSHEKRTH